MGFSVAILAFALADADQVLSHMNWRVTDQRVGVPVQVEDLLSGKAWPNDASNDPHFSAGYGDAHFFVYVSLSKLGPLAEPDFAALSRLAPLTAQIVVETSYASQIEHWDGGQQIWSVGGASGEGYAVSGPSPIDLEALADAWRQAAPAGEVPDENAALITEQFSVVLGAYFVTLTSFAYGGARPPLYRIEGTLPVRDMRLSR